MATTTYAVFMDREINDYRTECCDEAEHRPAPGEPTDPWFCMACGKTRIDPTARKA
jgi:hypothetical protein